MCAQFLIKSRVDELAKKFGIKLPQDIVNDVYDIRARGFIKTDLAPVYFLNEKNEIDLKMMKFSLCPTWSKEFPCGFSTYNARMERPKPKSPGDIERIYQVPTWRESFTSGKTCLIPLNGAIESSYFGKSAGKMIQFSQADQSVYYVVGLWSQWIDKISGEVHDTFTLITDDPYPFFFEHGHDRSVFVIDESQQVKWLTDKKLKPEARFNLLRENRVSLNWAVATDREMKTGWQKRAPSEQDISTIKVWNS